MKVVVTDRSWWNDDVRRKFKGRPPHDWKPWQSRRVYMDEVDEGWKVGGIYISKQLSRRDRWM